MLLKEYVEMVELNEGSTIEETLTELIDDLRGFVKANDEEESKETLKAIVKYIQKNVLKVGRVDSSRLVDKAVAERLGKIFSTVAKKLELEIPADVEERVEQSIAGKSIDKDEVIEKAKNHSKDNEEFDHDKQIKKERAAKKKDEDEDEEAHKGLEHEEDTDVEDATERAERLEKKQATKKRKTKDDDFTDVDAFINKALKR